MFNFYGDDMRWFHGLVVDTDGSGGIASDPLQLGRALIRIFGIHSDEVKDEDLPWASVIVPTTSAGVSGIGTNPMLKPGARVFGFFIDGKRSQIPVIWGSILQVEGPITGHNPNIGGIEGGSSQGGVNYIPPANPNQTSEGYPMSTGAIEQVIVQEANLRGIDPEVALQVWRHEGMSGYQSGIARSGAGSDGGREASYGPYQLFIGGGLGNEYQNATGRDLPTDCTVDGIITQIRWALDYAATNGWGPNRWYGYNKWKGISDGNTDASNFRDGLQGARPIGNWR